MPAFGRVLINSDNQRPSGGSAEPSSARSEPSVVEHSKFWNKTSQGWNWAKNRISGALVGIRKMRISAGDKVSKLTNTVGETKVGKKAGKAVTFLSEKVGLKSPAGRRMSMAAGNARKSIAVNAANAGRRLSVNAAHAGRRMSAVAAAGGKRVSITALDGGRRFSNAVAFATDHISESPANAMLTRDSVVNLPSGVMLATAGSAAMFAALLVTVGILLIALGIRASCEPVPHYRRSYASLEACFIATLVPCSVRYHKWISRGAASPSLARAASRVR